MRTVPRSYACLRSTSTSQLPNAELLPRENRIVLPFKRPNQSLPLELRRAATIYSASWTGFFAVKAGHMEMSSRYAALTGA
jgi:hypothetical protein